jgi:two-component system response regulator RegA
LPDAVRLLVVDDDEPYRARLARAFRERGLAVAEARSAEDALVVARGFRPDRAVLDLRMVRREHGETLDCIVLTGYGSIATALEAVRRGALDYLTKPADADEILRAFEKRDPEPDDPRDASGVPSLHRVEWEHIQRVLAACDGNVSRAARLLGLHRRTLQRKLATRPPAR